LKQDKRFTRSSATLIANGPPSAKFSPLAQTSSYATGYEICATRLLTFKTTKNSRACTEFFVKYICKSVMCTYVCVNVESYKMWWNFNERWV